MRLLCLVSMLLITACVHDRELTADVPSPRTEPKEFCDGLVQRVLRNEPDEFVNYQMAGIRLVDPSAFSGPGNATTRAKAEKAILESFNASPVRLILNRKEVRITLGEPRKLINKAGLIYAYPILGLQKIALICSLDITQDRVLKTRIGLIGASGKTAPTAPEKPEKPGEDEPSAGKMKI